MVVPLPYHCDQLAGDYLRMPCENNLVKAREYREKFPKSLLPYPLDYCEKCQGKELVTRKAQIAKYTGDIRPEVTREISTIRENQSGQKEEAMAEAERVLGPGKLTAVEVPRCPNHPEEPQVACGPNTKRAGQYLGSCKVCMVERGAKRIKVKDEMSPAVARDLAKKSVPVKPVCQISPDPEPINVHLDAMKISPEEKTITLLLDFTEYPEVFQKLRAEALASCRTPELQAIYFIKVSRT